MEFDLDGGSTSGPVATRWGVQSWPTLYLLDQKGIIRHIGLRGRELDEAIEKLIGKPIDKKTGAR